MKLAVVGSPGFIDRSYQASTETLFGQCGNNTGNLVFWYAFQSHVSAQEKKFFSFHFNPAEVNKCDAVVLMYANHINPNFDLGPFLDSLDGINVPIIALGLGLDAELDAGVAALPKGSVEYLRLLASKTESIGLRGEQTQRALLDIGIENTCVLGCVSNFITPDLRGKLRPWENKPVGKILLCNHNYSRATYPLNAAINMAFPNAFVENVVQAPLELLKIARNDADLGADVDHARLHDFLAPLVNPKRSLESLVQSVSAYYDTGGWLEKAKAYDLALGTRMHGNMVALQAGTPTLFCVHDARTDELCDTMRLPAIRADGLLSNLEDALERCLSSDAIDAYLVRREELFEQYLTFLAQANLKITPMLKTLHATPPARA